jgi:carbonic anhydrase
MDKLLAGYARFRARRWIEQRELFEQLAEGQKPRILVIACSDSRVDPAQIFDVAPGELFVVRNVAALVPPCEQGEGLHGTSAAIEFAIEGLGIRTVLVMGHARCGGVAAAVERGRWGTKSSTATASMSFVNAWIDLLKPVVEAFEGDDLAQAERGGIELSLSNLMTFPFVAKRLDAGELELTGARFDISTGELDFFHAPDGWTLGSGSRV